MGGLMVATNPHRPPPPPLRAKKKSVRMKPQANPIPQPAPNSSGGVTVRGMALALFWLVAAPLMLVGLIVVLKTILKLSCDT
jgi:hypothetical protein